MAYIIGVCFPQLNLLLHFRVFQGLPLHTDDHFLVVPSASLVLLECMLVFASEMQMHGLDYDEIWTVIDLKQEELRRFVKWDTVLLVLGN